ncbi:hypothetical protein [Ralstonia phage RSP15]|uniref:hypothetical protein n=1 Tax=Ralstonia phage RSP15 TaxID=1785960 RepID=UPI00074D47FE|nr:hypothetical protein BH754_gp020 [Ralstonia phage RSP15]BAU39978.1 hypothetical protein [Ralstonia phage RSP15]
MSLYITETDTDDIGYDQDVYFATRMARGIQKLDDEVLWLRQRVRELEGYKEKYEELLSQSVAHGEQMVGGILTLLLNGNLTATPKKEPIPENVYFRGGNFYCQRDCIGMGTAFYDKWRHRADEFPKEPH